MSMSLIALTGIMVLFVLMFLRMPISFAMFIVGYIGISIVASNRAAANIITADLWSQFSSYPLSIIPLYVLMGEIIYRTGITEKLFTAAYRWVGRFKGGMLWTTLIASSGFASICGSNSATAATMGTIALPELKKYGYDTALSTGSVAVGGTLGVIIPPSTVLIVIAIQIGQSVRDLFLAILVPAFLLVALLLTTVALLCIRNPKLGAAGETFSMKEKLESLIYVLPVFSLFLFVIGGLFYGFFSPTESGAFGAFGAFVLAIVMRKLTLDNLKQAVLGTLKSSTMVIMLIVGAMVFGRFLTLTRLPFQVADWAGSLVLPSILIIMMIIIIYIIGGAIMDSLGFLIISIPIFYPTVMALGYDPIWFAILLCIVTSMGAITPPVGVNVFVVKGLVPEVSITEIFKGVNYFLVAYGVVIILITVFPDLVLFVFK